MISSFKNLHNIILLFYYSASFWFSTAHHCQNCCKYYCDNNPICPIVILFTKTIIIDPHFDFKLSVVDVKINPTITICQRKIRCIVNLCKVFSREIFFFLERQEFSRPRAIYCDVFIYKRAHLSLVKTIAVEVIVSTEERKFVCFQNILNIV